MPRLTESLQKKLIIGLMTLAVLALAVWFFAWLEWEEYEVDLGYSEEARRNPFLAAQQFLESRGLEARVINDLGVLNQMAYKERAIGNNDLLILINAHRALTQQQSDNVKQWLETGGSLVLSTNNPFIDPHVAGEDALLRHFSIFIQEEVDEDDDHDLDHKQEEDEEAVTPNADSEDADGDQLDQDADARDEDEDDCHLIDQTSVVTSRGPSVDFEIGHLQGAPFYTEESLAVVREDSPPHHYLEFHHGAGRVAVIADNNIWRNRIIGCFDHAYALGLLAQNRNTVWFVLNTEAPSIWLLLWRHLPLAVISFTLALLLWLWARGKRFAPVTPRQKIARRSFLEHVRAGADFLWRHRQQQQLVAQLRHDILQMYSRRYAEFSKKTNPQKVKFISQVSGLTYADVDAALTHISPVNPDGFTFIVICLQRIRNSL